MPTKQCTKCRAIKPIQAFSRDKSKRDGHASNCRQCNSARGAIYRNTHKSEARLRSAAWQRTHKAELSVYGHAWYERHKEEVKARTRLSCKAPEHKEQRRNYARTYRRSDKGKAASALGRSIRRALKFGNTPRTRRLTREQWDKILALAKGRCHWCGKTRKPTMDHVIPLSKGGLHAAENIVVSCLACNRRKFTKIVTLF